MRSICCVKSFNVWRRGVASIRPVCFYPLLFTPERYHLKDNKGWSEGGCVCSTLWDTPLWRCPLHRVVDDSVPPWSGWGTEESLTIVDWALVPTSTETPYTVYSKDTLRGWDLFTCSTRFTKESEPRLKTRVWVRTSLWWVCDHLSPTRLGRTEAETF